MDFIGGNLDEYLHPERHINPAQQQGALGAAPQPQEEPAVPPQVLSTMPPDRLPGREPACLPASHTVAL